MKNKRTSNGGQRPLFSITCSALALLFAIPLVAIADDAKPVADPDPARFADGIAIFERFDAKNAWPADPILFVGSSSIRMWKTHNGFPDLPVINRGFGGAHISDVLHFFDQVVAPYNPRVIVFYCGDNDIAAGKTPERVHADYRAFIKRVYEKYPDTAIVYLPIKPSGSRWNHWPAMDEANKRIRADIEKDPKQTYVDLATILLGEDGKPRDDLFLKDRLHLNDEGYKLWNEKLAPVLMAALKQK
ncbi:MAG: hypothetical protein H6817_00880 [Phycisphaerales bacterium]|nr:hypothetical protein [Phycisphaerales bacterium]